MTFYAYLPTGREFNYENEIIYWRDILIYLSLEDEQINWEISNVWF